MFDSITVELYTTLDCNLNCAWCFQDRTQSKAKRMPIELAEEAMHKAVGYKEVTVNFIGGEPLMVGDAYVKELFYTVKAIALEQNQAFRAQMITNGVLLTQEFIEWAQTEDFHIIMSYDGPGKKHPKTKRNLPAIGKIQKQKSPLYMDDNVLMIIHDTNVDHLCSTVDDLHKAGIHKIHLGCDAFLPREKMMHYLDKLKEMWDYINDNNIPMYFGLIMDLLCYERYKRTNKLTFRFQEEFGRYNLGSEVHVYPDGQIRPCLATINGQFKHISEYNHFYDYFVSPEYQGYIQNWLQSLQTKTGIQEVDEFITYARSGSIFFFNNKVKSNTNLSSQNITHIQMMLRLLEHITSKPINNKYYKRLLGC
ncbi:radical SAM protein [Vibrio fortis]|uniref:radical SAM protein n=1 Tax=Vibrio fortis TaxID=212667 RepID=UPI0038CD34C1